METPAAYLVRGGTTVSDTLLSDPELTEQGLREAYEAAEFLSIKGMGKLIYIDELAEKQFAAVIANGVPTIRTEDELYAPSVFVCYPARKDTPLSKLVAPGGIAEWYGDSDIRPIFKSIQLQS